MSGTISKGELDESTLRAIKGLFHDANNLLQAAKSCVLLGRKHLQHQRVFDVEMNLEHVDQSLLQLSELLTGMRQLCMPSENHAARQISKGAAATTLLANSLPLVRALLPDNIDLSVQPGGVDSVVKMSEDEFNRVVLNLLVNGIAAIQGRGRISIKLDKQNLDDVCACCQAPVRGTYVVLSLSDNGVGIRPDNIGQIFKPYYSSKTDEGGLGLAVVDEVVHRGGGHIQVTSTEGQGSCFSVYLPVSADAV